MDNSFNRQVSALLAGCIDMHLHLNPHMAPNTHLMDVEEYAARAKQVKMRGALIKDASFPTTGAAYLVNKHSGSFQFHGSVMLNLFQGGLNPDAVSVGAEHGDGAKVIFFPTGDTYHHICDRYRFYRGINPMRPKEEGIRILRDGRLVPEVPAILDIIAAKDMCLATGHLSPEETLALVPEAVRRGVKKIIVSHAIWKMIGLSKRDLVTLADLGAYIEFEFGMFMPIMYFNHGETPANPLDVAELMRELGPRRCLMTSDCGQSYSPDPVDAMRYYIAVMLKCDMEPQDIDLMLRKNPCTLLGLPEAWEPDNTPKETPL